MTIRQLIAETAQVAGRYLQTVTKTGAYTIDSGTYPDSVIFCNFGAAAAITLPTPSPGRSLYIKDIAGNAAADNITISPHAAETIDGAASYVLNLNHAGVELCSDGINWFVVGSYNGTII